MSIQDKIESYLTEDDEFDELMEEVDLEDDSRVMDRMVDFMTTLSFENLTEEQQTEFVGIIEDLADEKTEEELSEFAAKRVKINRAAKRKRKREYRRNRAKMKMKARKFRRTAKFKQYKRKKKRKAKSGKTATGKRIRKFI